MSVVRPTHHFHNNVTMCMNEQINLVVPSWRLAGYEANECVYMCTIVSAHFSTTICTFVSALAIVAAMDKSSCNRPTHTIYTCDELNKSSLLCS